MISREQKINFLKAITGDLEAQQRHNDKPYEVVYITFNYSTTALKPVEFEGLNFEQSFLICTKTFRRPICVFRNEKNANDAQKVYHSIVNQYKKSNNGFYKVPTPLFFIYAY